MNENAQTQKNDLLSLTADIVAAHVSNNEVPREDLPTLMHQVFDTLSSIGKQMSRASLGYATTHLPLTDNTSEPAVPVEESVQPDYIVCLEDGRKMQMLKRYLRRVYGLSPDQYRQRWNLPADYPMVAPNYSKIRSRLAKDFGLGTGTLRSV